MRARTYLLALLLTLSGCAYFAVNGNYVRVVLMVVPGYLVIAYVLVLISTYLPGEEKRRFEAARAATSFPTGPRVETPGETQMHPAFMGAITVSAYSGDGFLGWPEDGDLVFRAIDHPPTTHQYPISAFRGFKVEASTPWATTGQSSIDLDRGALVLLDGGSAAMMVRIWVQPDDVNSFTAHLVAAGLKQLA